MTPRRSAERTVRGPTPESVRAVHAGLVRARGRPPRQRRGDPLDCLIGTLLSQNTTGANSRAAFAELKRRFPTWQACLQAPTEAVIAAINCAGLARTRGPRIQAVLARIRHDQGELTLDALHETDSALAMTYLQSLPGVGPKTAACVLLFACRRQVFPVDTHVARIAVRLGWAAEGASPERIQERLEPLVPPALRYPLHVNLIAHGRLVCRAGRPRCAECVVREHCATGRRQ
ncbi:MAG: endonuclease III [Armatimonadetes bacterium]|nr:endonuclease III [Armatimonadota bacterium]